MGTARGGAGLRRGPTCTLDETCLPTGRGDCWDCGRVDVPRLGRCANAQPPHVSDRNSLPDHLLSRVRETVCRACGVLKGFPSGLGGPGGGGGGGQDLTGGRAGSPGPQGCPGSTRGGRAETSEWPRQALAASYAGVAAFQVALAAGAPWGAAAWGGAKKGVLPTEFRIGSVISAARGWSWTEPRRELDGIWRDAGQDLQCGR